MSKLLKFTHPDDFATEIAYLIEEKILDAYDRNGLARIALSGGSTPLPIYRKLAESQVIPWDRLEIYLVDERFVPASDNLSNQKQISDIFGANLTFVHALETWDTSLSIQESSKTYNENLEAILDEEDFLFDLVILGMGVDGHTASLFPKDLSTLHNTEDLSTFTLNSTGEPKERLTLTYQALDKSDDIYVLLSGEEKIKTLEKVLGQDSDYFDFPIRKIIDEHQNTTIFVLNEATKSE
jgi:6-phosphogluconolactonase